MTLTTVIAFVSPILVHSATDLTGSDSHAYRSGIVTAVRMMNTGIHIGSDACPITVHAHTVIFGITTPCNAAQLLVPARSECIGIHTSMTADIGTSAADTDLTLIIHSVDA